MDFRQIIDENLYEYSDKIDCDVAEDLNRIFYRGLAAHDADDDSLLSLLIWEFKSVEDAADTESELKWIYAIDSKYISPILECYHAKVHDAEVKKTYFESVSLDEEKETALKECGFSLESVESKDINVTVDECKALSIAKKDAPPYIQSISNLSDDAFNQGLMNILFKYDNPALEDIMFLPKDWYEQTISCCTKTDGKVTGLLLVHLCPSGTLVPVLFFAVGADSRISLVEMMRFSISMAANIYSGDTIIRIHRRTPEVKALSGKLFPNKKGAPAVAGKRLES